MNILIRFNNCTVPLGMINKDNVYSIPDIFIVEIDGIDDDEIPNSIGYAKKKDDKYIDMECYFGDGSKEIVESTINVINNLL